MKKTTSAEIFSAKAQRIFSTVLVLLAAVLVLTAPVGAVNAWDGVSEDGSWYNPSGPFTIMNGSQLSNFSKLVNAGTDFTGKTVMLDDNIYLDKKEWTPIGNSSGKYFNGTFNGSGKNITGLSISTASTDTQGYFGLFGYVGSGGVIQNLHVSGIINVAKSGTNYAGGLVGYFEGGIIENCSSAVTVNLTSNSAGSYGSFYLGGIAGSLSGGTIKNCYSYISENPIRPIQASSDSHISIYAGGIVGAVKSNGLVENCYATGGVAANHYNSGTCYAGGIVGWIESGNVKNCFALNKYVQATSIDSSNQLTNNAYYGRVAGGYSGSSGNCLENNNAWDGMTYIGNIITGDDSANQKNGESKSSNDFWGKTTLPAIFNDESVWEPCTTNDKFQLPILKNLPEPRDADASYLSPSNGGQGGSTSENNNGGGSSAIILSSTSKYRDTVKAEFKEITFDANGGVGYMEGQQLPVGEAGTLNYNEFSYEGYEFVGWALEPTGLVVYADGEEVTIQGDVTLYAVWVQPIPEIPDVPEPVDTPMPVAGMILGLFGAALILRRK